MERQEISRKLKQGQNQKSDKASHRTKLTELAQKRTGTKEVFSKRTRTTEYSSSPEPEERIITLEDIKSIIVTRSQIEKWCYFPFFEEIAKKLFVRVNFAGDANSKSGYCLTMIAGMFESLHKRLV